jgi:DinB superfamily
MKYVSKQLLDSLYAQTEAAVEKAVAQWQQLSPGVLNAAPAPGKWSAAQCLEHLNSYGRYYLPAIEKALLVTDAPPAVYFKSGMLGNYFYKLMLTDGNGKVKKEMTAPKNHRPAENPDTAAVLSEFIDQLEKTGQLLTLAQQKNINKAKVPISIAPFIKLKAGDTFLFFTAHILRHIQQAERALKAAGAITATAIAV